MIRIFSNNSGEFQKVRIFSDGLVYVVYLQKDRFNKIEVVAPGVKFPPVVTKYDFENRGIEISHFKKFEDRNEAQNYEKELKDRFNTK